MGRAVACALALSLCGSARSGVQQDPSASYVTGFRAAVAERLTKLTRDSRWTLVTSIPMRFPTHHPQGMVKIGETLFVSSVEIKEPTRRLPQPAGGYDRDTGAGIGHLFKADMAGNLLADLRIGEGTIYHPGGIDFDGRDIWVPVAEYRPDSRAIVYRVDPGAMRATEVFRHPDHIGAIVRNVDDGTVHGVSWGSRRFYRWNVVGPAPAAVERGRTLNPSHYVDYQDCKYAGGGRMLCSGVTEIRQAPHGPPFRLGGLELVDLEDGRPLHQVPVLLWTAKGLAMTHNPVWLEPVERASEAGAGGLRAYFMPEDDKSVLYVYEVETP